MTLALAQPCAAQGSLEVTPLLGAYVPTASIPDISNFACGSLLDPKFGNAVAFGGRAGGWLTDRFAMEGSVWYAKTRSKGRGALER
jgi:hypothetical protein